MEPLTSTFKPIKSLAFSLERFCTHFKNRSDSFLETIPSVKILKSLTKELTLFNTILVSANDALVELYLKEKIKFTDINKKILKIIKTPEFIKYQRIKPKNVNQILKLKDHVSSKIYSKSI